MVVRNALELEIALRRRGGDLADRCCAVLPGVLWVSDQTRPPHNLNLELNLPLQLLLEPKPEPDTRHLHFHFLHLSKLVKKLLRFVFLDWI